MADGFTLDWQGSSVLSKTRKAQVEGVNEIAVACVQEAGKVPPHPFQYGIAVGSLKAEPAKVQGTRVSALWGSFDVDYYIWLELRGNMLRNSADKNYPKLAEAIKKRMK